MIKQFSPHKCLDQTLFGVPHIHLNCFLAHNYKVVTDRRTSSYEYNEQLRGVVKHLLGLSVPFHHKYLVL